MTDIDDVGIFEVMLVPKSKSIKDGGCDSDERIIQVALKKWTRTNNKPIPVEQLKTEYPHRDRIPFQTLDMVKKNMLAQCYLHIWELEPKVRDSDLVTAKWYTKVREFSWDSYLSRRIGEDQWVATIPGVVAVEDKKFSFHPTGDPILNPRANIINGRIVLSMTRAGETEPEPFNIYLPIHEGVFELATLLVKEKGGNRARNIIANNPPEFVRVKNTEASLMRQLLERRGFAVAFVADYKDETEFYGQAEEMISTLPTFVESDDDDKLVEMGYYKISGRNEIASKLKELMKKVNKKVVVTFSAKEWDEWSKYLKGYTCLPPRVAVLELYSHGSPSAVAMDLSGSKKYTSASGALTTEDVPDFVADIIPYLSDNVVIPLFACHCGRTQHIKEAEAKDRHGVEFPCEELGADSLAWVLYRELRNPTKKKKKKELPQERQSKERISYPTIWAHVTAGHTTRNPWLRAFSPYGTADFINILTRARGVIDKTYIDAFKYEKDKLDKKTKEGEEHRKRCFNSNLLRTISVQSALHFDWSWNGGPDGSRPLDTTYAKKSSPKVRARARMRRFQNRAKAQVNGVLEDVRDNVWILPEDIPRRKDEMEYDDKRAYIVGKVRGVENPRLSENFSYEEAEEAWGANPMRLSVQLMKYIQLLRYRAKREMKLKKILFEGDGIAIEALGKGKNKKERERNKKKNHTKILKKAHQMRKDGFFSNVKPEEEDKKEDNVIYIQGYEKHIYFAIYYPVEDDAFKRAAETWRREVEQRPSYHKGIDVIMIEEAGTEKQFEKAWRKIAERSNENSGAKGVERDLPGAKVVEGHLFTHASKQTDDWDGLEFPDAPEGKRGERTVTRKEIAEYPVLDWAQDGFLVLHGCNTGLKGKRKWTPAQAFADRQKVKTFGQSGYAYFSQKGWMWERIDKESPEVYLWAYKHRKNVLPGGGIPLPIIGTAQNALAAYDKAMEIVMGPLFTAGEKSRIGPAIANPPRAQRQK